MSATGLVPHPLSYSYVFPYHRNRAADPYYDSYIRSAYYSPYNLETYDGKCPLAS